MMFRTLVAAVATVAIGLWSAGPVRAEEKGDTHEGTVVKAGSATLVMKAEGDDKEHSHAVAPDAKITCDGKECKLDELKPGCKVKVTTEKKDDKTVVTRIDAKKAE
jgi:hypothetical protein